ncbi:MAG: phosphatidylcholine/phosphatidylserine synthase [Rhodanobacter sp.]|uniref:CDP-alcohol phosphatidyltransferase family protein n=2 Tax=unclassified Rhodanobacter TaxID=2621553 RepID=A0AB74UPL4_9GAMM|nr:phosphatidylcholine/phosphatidylserine synthase [Rhodanobacter sp.]MBN8947312.1 phosphatidylcholine/phosphatidylserine synthase [Rhodanobacter sp.]ODT95966.1 MAG: CDP-diacylglycerol--serine O-phosphatidyltransferase [Rhodanobacter sp. SCN 67-45]OJW41952.1 MAG: CDP-diacylglycerol--serine O-phosphatidyltransferase [Rhodanobacter sp. 67-28]
MSPPMPVQPPRHRGIYLLPNLFTTAAMFAGFYAIISSIGGHYVEAAIAVFLAAVLDGMDGRVARMTGTQTEFGVQYDSLSDLVSFGLAPALVMYTWSLSALRDVGPLWGKLGWACAFIYAACAALRLARFNTQAGVADKRYFQGLASPAAAAVNMSFVWTMEKAGWSGAELAFASAAIVVVTGLLMVSRFRYFSFKSLPMGERGNVPFAWMVVAVLLLALLYLAPARVLLAGFTVYLLSGPVWTIAARIAHRRRARHSAR